MKITLRKRNLYAAFVKGAVHCQCKVTSNRHIVIIVRHPGTQEKLRLLSPKPLNTTWVLDPEKTFLPIMCYECFDDGIRIRPIGHANRYLEAPVSIRHG